LPEVLRAAGAAPDLHDPARWHSTQGAISVTGPKFYNWNRGVGGGGAIDLVIHLYGLDFLGALAWLAERFAAAAPSTPSAPAPARPLQLPRPAPDNLPAVKAYLSGVRRLPPVLIDPLIGSGDLYADHRANAAFLLRNPRNLPVGAELRGTGTGRWRGMAPGSQKDRGYFSIPRAGSDVIILCESAIDAISCHHLHPSCRCISTAGARPNPAWLSSLVRQNRRIYCGYDQDQTGDDMARLMIEIHPAIIRLRPPRRDWNLAL
jgi:hypothetical protein